MLVEGAECEDLWRESLGEEQGVQCCAVWGRTFPGTLLRRAAAALVAQKKAWSCDRPGTGKLLWSPPGVPWPVLETLSSQSSAGAAVQGNWVPEPWGFVTELEELL